MPTVADCMPEKTHIEFKTHIRFYTLSKQTTQTGGSGGSGCALAAVLASCSHRPVGSRIPDAGRMLPLGHAPSSNSSRLGSD
jgi:hypothetical protein